MERTKKRMISIKQGDQAMIYHSNNHKNKNWFITLYALNKQPADGRQSVSGGQYQINNK